MILVLLGTQNNNFDRLLKEIDNCINNKIINDKVIVQTGYTQYSSNKMEILDFIPVEQFNNLLKEADLIITHGGVGSIITAIKLNKKVIAVPRLQKYKEHINNHQIQIVEALDEFGYLKGVFDINNLGNTIKIISEFTPKQYISNTENIIKIITNYIDNN
ncbi:MAG: PssE/Cps14G family polysaccharide biosynthesis glycosyltransferase [Clostridia bacterium]|nr:PssE/Cps14G family polysaccharide biosynthesis glycosyltransferase [Clostridia bacterium]